MGSIKFKNFWPAISGLLFGDFHALFIELSIFLKHESKKIYFGHLLWPRRRKQCSLPHKKSPEREEWSLECQVGGSPLIPPSAHVWLYEWIEILLVFIKIRHLLILEKLYGIHHNSHKQSNDMIPFLKFVVETQNIKLDPF